MCTVVLRVDSGDTGDPVRILALRDEFEDREFDEPDTWWPDQPDVVGGRDRRAGGTWCASDVTSGVTALLVNRIERFAGTPSRGLLPLAALARGENWMDAVDHRTMAGFNLILAGPSGVVVWVWDAVELRRTDLGAGTHLVTSRGIDADDAKTVRFAPAFDGSPVGQWRDVVGRCTPDSAESALVVRRDHEGRTYATVFGQSIDAAPGRLTVTHTRTPWRAESWREQTWHRC